MIFFCLIIGGNVAIYRTLLAIPSFARFLTIGRIFDFMVLFGHDVQVTAIKEHHWNGLTTYKKAIAWYLYKTYTFNKTLINKPLHRVDGPALLYERDRQEWYYLNELHRIDGPAAIRSHVNWYREEWYIHDKYHRTNGPAITERNYNCDTKEIWCINHQRHRENGPAVIVVNRRASLITKKWYLNE